jgi:hypothetical protein
MAREPGGFDTEQLVAELRERADRERAAGAYAEDLSGVELQTPSIAEGFDLHATEPRVRFRPELGFSSKPVIGPVITLVKRFILRLQLHVFDDLARQADTAIARVEAALAVEIAARERLEDELQGKTGELDARLTRLEQEGRPPAADAGE